jgi:hypothetical protein
VRKAWKDLPLKTSVVGGFFQMSVLGEAARVKDDMMAVFLSFDTD